MFLDDGAASDAQLVRLAQAGDRLACATLFQRHRGLAMRMCRRILGSTEGVEDALQEAALQALLSWDRLRRPDRFSAWFVGIAIHMCHRMLRSRPADEWSLEALDGGRSVPERVDVGASVEDTVQVSEVVRRVQAAVAELPTGQRAAVLLVYLGGFTHTEVGEMLGIRTGAVKTRLHKARNRLRSDMRSIWEDFMSDETPAPASNGRLLDARVTDVRRDADGQLWVILRESAGVREHWLAARRSLEADALAVVLQGQRLPGWLYDELVREPAETALVREAPDKAPKWVDGALRSVRLMVRDDHLVGVLDIAGDDGQSTEAVDGALKALLRAQVTRVPLQIEKKALKTSSHVTTAGMASDPFGPRSMGASQLAGEVFARWQRWRTEGPDWVPMRVVDVFARGPDDAGHYRHIVMLGEVDGGRYLPIWVGQSEGAGLAVLLAGVETPDLFRWYSWVACRPRPAEVCGKSASIVCSIRPSSPGSRYRGPTVSRPWTHGQATRSRLHCTWVRRSRSPRRCWSSPGTRTSNYPTHQPLRKSPRQFWQPGRVHGDSSQPYEILTDSGFGSPRRC